MNGMDSMRLHPRWRGVQENYEPLVWKHMMNHVRKGDTVVDVGAFIGLYAIALAKRVGPGGLVLAFEPDPSTFGWLQQHVALNHVGVRVKLFQSAVGHQVGKANFMSGINSQAHVEANQYVGIKVPITTLDKELPNQRVDVLKIDVEGFEEKVLQGAIRLLKDPIRCPRSIYIEMHPYAWKELGSAGKSLLRLLRDCDYKISKLDGHPAENIDDYGEIVASRNLDNR